MAGVIVAPYAGPRGWSEGLRRLGLADIGIELDGPACATAVAAGHRTIRADVAEFPIGHLVGRVDGLIMSPPCQTFSAAGKGDGRAEVAALVAAVHAGDWSAVDHTRAAGYGHVLEVGRWVETIRPAWVACEQVREVLPVWQAYARRWRAMGWSVWAGVLNAADYGVPQTRRRAFLIASRTRTIGPPPATHDQSPQPSLFGPELRPWVTMADALGWPAEARYGFPRRDDRGDSPDGYRERDWSPASGPAPSLTEKARSVTVRMPRWALDRRQQVDGTPIRPVPIDEPAPTLTGMVVGRGLWVRTDDDDPPPITLGRVGYGRSARTLDQPAPTLAFGHDSASWVWTAPATTVAGDPRISARCHHEHGTQGRDAKSTAQVRAGDYTGTEPIRLTLAEALVLQSFRSDYPVQGNNTKRFEQVGNAVPPLMAAHVVAAATGQSVSALDAPTHTR